MAYSLLVAQPIRMQCYMCQYCGEYVTMKWQQTTGQKHRFLSFRQLWHVSVSPEVKVVHQVTNYICSAFSFALHVFLLWSSLFIIRCNHKSSISASLLREIEWAHLVKGKHFFALHKLSKDSSAALLSRIIYCNTLIISLSGH